MREAVGEGHGCSPRAITCNTIFKTLPPARGINLLVIRVNITLIICQTNTDSNFPHLLTSKYIYLLAYIKRSAMGVASPTPPSGFSQGQCMEREKSMSSNNPSNEQPGHHPEHDSRGCRVRVIGNTMLAECLTEMPCHFRAPFADRYFCKHPSAKQFAIPNQPNSF